MSRRIAIFLVTMASSLFLAVSGWLEPVAVVEQTEKEVDTGQEDPRDVTLAAQFDAYLRRSRQAEPVPALAAAIVRGDRMVHLLAEGVGIAGTTDSIDEHTVFRIASLSKGFAPVLTGLLFDEGCLNWDDRVADWAPWIVLQDSAQTRAITLRHVLSHTTGLPRHTYSNLLNMGVAYRDILAQLPTVPLPHPPGTYYNYQNVAYSFIGDVIAAATGRTYSDLLAERLFCPAGMADASATFEAIAGQTNVAWPHVMIDSGYARVALEDDYYEVIPAAGVNASITDMAYWLMLMMGQRPDLIDPSTLAEILRPQVEVSTAERVFHGWRGLDRAWYGLGWRVLDWRGRRLIYHGGYVNNYRAEIAFDPVRRIGLVVLANSTASFLSDCVQQFFELEMDLFPPDVSLPAPSLREAL